MKNKIISLVFLLMVPIMVYAANPAIITLIQSATSAQTSTAVNFFPGSELRTHQVTLEGASSIAASGVIQGSNDGNQWLTIAPFSVTSSVPSAASSISETYAIERIVLTGITSSASAVGSGLTVTVAY